MKKAVIAVFIGLILMFCACGTDTQAEVLAVATPTPTATVEAAAGGDPGQTEKPAEPSPSPAATVSKSSLYDPSIFVIEASAEWQDELAPEYFANNECELYLHKIDANDNRAVAGSYQGCFWMKTSLDTAGYIDEMFGDIPIDMSFDAGGEAVCDNLGISLNTTDDKAWVNYSITGEDGEPLPLTRETPVGKGSFVMVAKDVYLEAHATGKQGETVDYSDASDGDIIDVNYVIHVQPDSAESGGERKVVIYLSGENFSVTLNGTMRRLPGYTEDVSDYLSSSDYQDSAWSRFQ